MTRGACDGPGAAETGDRETGGLYEREAELAVLSQALTEARAGTGGLVVVEGPAGIGKSRLLAEARAAAAARGMTVLTARGTDLERDAPFGVVAELFAAIRTATSIQAGSGRLTGGQAALATPLFDPAVPPGDDPSALVRGLYWLTVDAAWGAPEGRNPGLLIEVDDAQWSDRPSLSYLAYLAARIDELPAALVVAVRGAEDATDQRTLDWLRERAGHWVLKPRVLSPEAVTR